MKTSQKTGSTKSHGARRATVLLALVAALGSACASASPPRGVGRGAGPGYTQMAAASSTATEATGAETARQLRRTAQLEIGVGDVAAAARQAQEIIERAGGYVENSTSDPEGNATIAARVPSARFEETLAEFSGFGRELRRVVTAEDVTDQLIDLDTRVTNQRKLRDRLRALFERGGGVEELLKVEVELARVQTELERLEAQQQTLQRQVALASIQLTLTRERWPGPGGIALRALNDTIEWIFRYPRRAVLSIP